MHGHTSLVMGVLVRHWCGLIVKGLMVSMVAHGVVVVHRGVLRVGPLVVIARWAQALVAIR